MPERTEAFPRGEARAAPVARRGVRVLVAPERRAAPVPRVVLAGLEEPVAQAELEAQAEPAALEVLG